MSEENVEAVREPNAAMMAMDWAAAAAPAHPDIEMDMTRSHVRDFAEVYRGIDEVGRNRQGGFEAWEAIPWDGELIHAGEAVIQWGLPALSAWKLRTSSTFSCDIAH